MRRLDAWRFGVALAVTVGTGYAICTLVWLLLPVPSMAFLNTLFHGLDFGRLHTEAAFALGHWLMAFAVLTAWAFLWGTLLAFAVHCLGPAHDHP